MEVVFLGGHVFHKIIFLVNSYVFFSALLDLHEEL